MLLSGFDAGPLLEYVYYLASVLHFTLTGKTVQVKSRGTRKAVERGFRQKVKEISNARKRLT